jgi:endonuclease/exonuclease/phosphatase family metal-dependent hydrolase
MKLRVVTLNVWNNEGDPRRMEIINDELHRLSPDLVAFQEVVHGGADPQLDRLLSGLGLHATHQADALVTDLPGSDRYGGSAVATRWPHHLVEVLDMRTAEAADVPWATLAVLVPIPDEGNLLFIGTTAAWRLNAEAARERQAIALTDLDARHRQALPSIIAGDFNAAPDAASIRYLSGLQSLSGRSVQYHDAWGIAGKEEGFTWSVDNPNAKTGMGQIVRQRNVRRRIDYIFVGSWHSHPKARCEIHAARLVFDRPTNGVWPSDHFGLLVDLEVAKDR